jgi:hypothetical protein
MTASKAGPEKASACQFAPQGENTSLTKMVKRH